MTRIYFVRHAQPVHTWEDDRTRPLTAEGIEDSKQVLEFLKDKKIDCFYCSPYKRSLDTIRSSAEYYQMKIQIDERLREREKGVVGNSVEMIRKRWDDLNYHEEGGESIQMVQNRNMHALKDIIKVNLNKNIVIGTHGTALSSILRYYDTSFHADAFFRIIDWMPYVVELDFENNNKIRKTEHVYKYKEFTGDKQNR